MEHGKRRKSSILKPPKVRNPLSDLDLKVSGENDEQTTDTTGSRRVSFSRKKGVALFSSDHGNTIWHNFYEEANKPDLSDSSGAGAHQSQNPVPDCSSSADSPQIQIVELYPDNAANDSKENEIPQYEENEYLESDFPAGNHDVTFATLPNPCLSPDDDHCGFIGGPSGVPNKPTDKAFSEMIMEISHHSFGDRTDALINCQIGSNGTPDVSLHAPSKSIESNGSKNIQEMYQNELMSNLDLTITNVVMPKETENLASESDETKIFNEDDGDLSITQPISSQDFPIGEAKLSKQFVKSYELNCSSQSSSSNSSDWLKLKDDVQVPVKFANDTMEDSVDEIFRNKIKKVSTFNPYLDFSSKNSGKSEVKKSNEENLRKSNMLSQEMLFVDKENIIFDQQNQETDLTVGNMLTSDLIDRGIKRKTIENNRQTQESLQRRVMECPLEVLDKENRRKTILFNQESPESDLSMTRMLPENFDEYDVEMVDEASSNQTSQDDSQSECNMSMTVALPGAQFHEKQRKSCVTLKPHEFDMSMACANPKIAFDERKSKIGFDETKSSEPNMSMTTVLPKVTLNENKRKSCFADQKSSEFQNDMSMTCAVPKTAFDERKSKIGFDETKSSEPNMSMTTVLPKVTLNENKRKSCFADQKASEFQNDMSMTCAVPKTAFDERKSKIGFDETKSAECNMSMTSVVPKVAFNENKRKSCFDDQKASEFENNMSMTCAVPKTAFDERKSKIGFDETKSAECNMSMTSVLPKVAFNENKRKSCSADQKTLEFENDMSITCAVPKTAFDETMSAECNMSMTSVVPKVAFNENKRKSCFENQKASEFENNMSITCAVPKTAFDERKSKIGFDETKSAECNMSMTSVLPKVAFNENKRKSCFDDQKASEFENDMSMTCVVPKTAFDETMSAECNMSMTSVVPKVAFNENKRKSCFDDQKASEFENNMSMTCAVPKTAFDERKSKIGFDETKSAESNMSMTSVPSKVAIEDNERTTSKDIACAVPKTAFDENKIKSDFVRQKAFDFDISMTSVVPKVAFEEKEITLVGFQASQCDMSMTSALPKPKIDENKTESSVIDMPKPVEFNMSMTSVVPKTAFEKNKKSCVTSQKECDMSMTFILPKTALNENKRKSCIASQKECDMSMTSVLPKTAFDENKRKSGITSQNECNMSMTSILPKTAFDENKRKSCIASQKECDMSMTSVLPEAAFDENKRKSCIASQKECDMSMTSVLPKTAFDENKRKSCIASQKECDMSMTSILPKTALDENKRKSCIASQKECDMSMTSVLPKTAFDENKRKSGITSQNECDMSMTSLLPKTAFDENKRKSCIASQKECDMSMTSVLPKTAFDENKRQTGIASQRECDMSMTSILPKTAFDENKRKSCIASQKECDMSMTSVLPKTAFDENKRQTGIASQRECDMSMTSILPKTAFDENKRKSCIASQKECDMSMTSVLPETAFDENKRQPGIASQKECDMSMTSVVPKMSFDDLKTSENDLILDSPKLIAVECGRMSMYDSKLGDCEMPMTCAVRKSVLKDDGNDSCLGNAKATDFHMSWAAESVNAEDKNKSVFHQTSEKTQNESIDHVLLAGNSTAYEENNHKSIINDQEATNSNISSNSVIFIEEFNNVENNKYSEKFKCNLLTQAFHNETIGKSSQSNLLSDHVTDVDNNKADVSAFNISQVSNRNVTLRNRSSQNFSSRNTLNEISMNQDSFCKTSKIASTLSNESDKNLVENEDVMEVDLEVEKISIDVRLYENLNAPSKSHSISHLNLNEKQSEERKTSECSFENSDDSCEEVNMSKRATRKKSQNRIITRSLQRSVNNTKIPLNTSKNVTLESNKSKCEISQVNSLVVNCEENCSDEQKRESNTFYLKRKSDRQDVEQADFSMCKKIKNLPPPCLWLDNLILEDTETKTEVKNVQMKSTREFDHHDLDNVNISLVNSSLDRSESNVVETMDEKEMSVQEAKELHNEESNSSNVLTLSDTKFLNASVCPSMVDSARPSWEKDEEPSDTPKLSLVDIVTVMDMDKSDCLAESLQGEEWSFSLFLGNVHLRVRFALLVPGCDSLQRPITAISVEPLDIVHTRRSRSFEAASASALSSLLREELSPCVFSHAGELPELLRRCCALSSQARGWSRELYRLHLACGLRVSQKHGFTFEMASAILGCIWQVEASCPLGYALPQDITVKQTCGRTQLDFSSALTELPKDWTCLTTLANRMNQHIIKSVQQRTLTIHQ